MWFKKIVENWKDFDGESPILAATAQVVFTVLVLSLLVFPGDWNARLVLLVVIAIFVLIFGIQPSLGFKKFIAIIIAVGLPIGIVWFIGWAIISLAVAIANAFRTSSF